MPDKKKIFQSIKSVWNKVTNSNDKNGKPTNPTNPTPAGGSASTDNMSTNRSIGQWVYETYEDICYWKNWISNKINWYYPDFLKSAGPVSAEDQAQLYKQQVQKAKERNLRDAIVEREKLILSQYDEDLGFFQAKEKITENWGEIEKSNLYRKKLIQMGVVPPVELDSTEYSTVPGWEIKGYDRAKALKTLCGALQCQPENQNIMVSDVPTVNDFRTELKFQQLFSDLETCGQELEEVKQSLSSCIAIVKENNINTKAKVDSVAVFPEPITTPPLQKGPEVVQPPSPQFDTLPVINNSLVKSLMKFPLDIMNYDIDLRGKKSRLLTKLMIPLFKILAAILVLLVYYQVTYMVFNLIYKILDNITDSLTSYLPHKNNSKKKDRHELNRREQHHQEMLDMWRHRVGPMAEFFLNSRGGSISISHLHPVYDKQLILGYLTPEIYLVLIELERKKLQTVLTEYSNAESNPSNVSLLEEKRLNLINNPKVRAGFIGTIIFFNSNLSPTYSLNSRSIELKKQQEMFQAISIEENMKEHVELGNAVKTADFNSANKMTEPVKIATLTQKNRIKKVKKPFKQVTLTEFLEKNPTTDSENIIQISKVGSVNSRIQIRIPQ